MTAAEKWEYLTRFMFASSDNQGALEYYLVQWPGEKPKKYDPETLVPELNALGDTGWEMVHMQPIGAVGKNRDVGFVAGEITPRWSNSYFCVFKRRKL
jgi:hypothetical protein